MIFLPRLPKAMGQNPLLDWLVLDWGSLDPAVPSLGAASLRLETGGHAAYVPSDTYVCIRVLYACCLRAGPVRVNFGQTRLSGQFLTGPARCVRRCPQTKNIQRIYGCSDEKCGLCHGLGKTSNACALAGTFGQFHAADKYMHRPRIRQEYGHNVLSNRFGRKLIGHADIQF